MSGYEIGASITEVPLYTDSSYIKVQHTSGMYKPDRIAIVLTFDCSNSMKGLPFECGKKAICDILPDLVSEFSDIVLIIYNHNINEIIVTKDNVANVIRRVSTWLVGGATNFTKVFNRINYLLANRLDKYACKVDFRVSFFTDGQHYTGQMVLRTPDEFPRNRSSKNIK
jgi:uncharacterized protein with von Willebrand factor type A (vWA) domain